MISGAVHDATGAPVDGALVAVVPVDGGDVAGLVGSRADGSFSVGPLKAGTYGVTATAAGREGTFAGNVVVTATQPASLSLTLGEKGATIDGSVTELDGRPVRSALVSLSRSSKERGDVWYTRSDAGGRFHVVVPNASYAVIAKAQGFQGRAEYVDASAETATLHLEMAPDDVSRYAGENVVAQLHAASVAPRTSDPGAENLDDLAGLEHFVGDARLVGLGEGVHGGHEIFQLKHRLFRFLVEKMGFTVLAIEASWPDTIALNDYVVSGRGDPALLVPAMRFWIWNSDELIALVRWMRAYNADARHPRKLQIVGFDMQYAPSSVAALHPYLDRVDRAWSARARRDLAKLADEYEAGHVERWPAADREAATRAVHDLLGAFEEHRAQWVKRTGAEAWAMARHHVEILSQFLQLGTDWRKYNDTRDRFMAENVKWIVAQQPPGTKIALWAANTHLSKVPWYGAAPNTGKLLHDAFGAAYVVFATSFVSGAVRAASINPPRGILAFNVPTAPPGTVEGTLGRIGPDLVGVDLAHLAAGSDAARWSHYRLEMRLIGAAYTESMKASLITVRPADLYDAIFVVRHLTPSHYLGPNVPPKPPLSRPENLNFEAAAASPPAGWVVSSLGIQAGYRAGLREHDCFEGERCGVLSRPGPILMPGFASLQQSIDAKELRDRRVRLRAEVRLERDVDSGGARLFLQSEDRDGNVLAAANATELVVRGTHWENVAVSVDVPPNAAVLRYGIVVSGSEPAWIDAVSIEPIEKTTSRAP